MIEHGVLRCLLHSIRTTHQAGDGARSTGNAFRRSFRALSEVGATNLLLAPGLEPAQALLARVGQGFYCQSLMGVQAGVNTVTGQFSCGAVGLMIRDGALAEPVRETTIALTLPAMLHGIVAVAEDLRVLPSGATGRTLLIAEMTVIRRAADKIDVWRSVR